MAVAASMAVSAAPGFAGSGALTEAVKLDAKASPFEGRWTQTGRDQGEGHELDIGTLEIAKCVEGFCGRLVERDTCGRVMMTMKAEGDDRITGEFTLNDTKFTGSIGPGETAGQMTLSATEGDSLWSREAMVISADLVRKGPVRCTAAPSS